MFKKIAVTAIAIGAGWFLLRSTHVGAYARTAWSKAQTSMHQQIPLEFQLETIRNEVANLVPDMKRHIGQVASETVKLESLREDIVSIRTNLNAQKELVSAMADELRRSDNKTVAFRSKSYSQERFQQRLATELQAAKTCAENLKIKEQFLEVREQALEKAKTMLGSMRNQKQALELQVAQLESELKSLRLTQCRSDFQLDDSRLAQIKAALADVRSQMKVDQVTLRMVGEFDGDLNDATEAKIPSKADLVREATEFAGKESYAKADKDGSDK